MAEESKRKGNGGDKKQVVFEYIKSQNFRVIHADGAIGSLTAPGYIHMAIYSERPAIPKRMAHRLNDNFTLGEIIPSETVAREGVIREMDVDILMDLKAAQSISLWLAQKVDELKAKHQKLASNVQKPLGLKS